MYKLRCSALGVGDCEFEAAGETLEAALLAGKAHITQAHTDMLQTMNDTMTVDEIDSRLESVVRDA